MLESELVGVGARVADLPRSVREAISSSDQWFRDTLGISGRSVSWQLLCCRKMEKEKAR